MTSRLKLQFPVELGLTEYGWMFYMPQDKYLGQSLKRYGCYSPSEVKFIRGLIRKGDVAADCGANIGVMSLVMGQAGAVVNAFEPQPTIHSILKANISINNLENTVIAHNCAVGAHGSTITLPRLNYNYEENYGAFGSQQWEQYEGQLEVPQIALDDHDIKRLDFIKLDVEGMELEALAGMERTIAKFKPVMLVENDRAEHGAELIERVYALSYTPYWFPALLYEKEKCFYPEDNTFGYQCSFNMICIPPERPVELQGFRVAKPDDPIGTCDAKDIVVL